MTHLTRALTLPALAALIGTLGLTPAAARPQPIPPPSGIVVHLFGPDSITSHILPTAPQPASPGAQATQSAPGAQATQSAPGTQAATPQASSETWGDVAHQMFVVGDPSQEGPNALPKGRAGDWGAVHSTPAP